MNLSSSFSVIVLIVGPAGSGKSTFAEWLEKKYRIKRVITTTTRAPREGEIDGVHYRFVSPARFKEMVDRGEFIEWSSVHSETGEPDRFYGVRANDLMEAIKSGGVFTLSIDIQGFVKLRSLENPELQNAFISFFIDASDQTLLRRLQARDANKPDQAAVALDHQKRMASVPNEREKAKAFLFHSVMNEDGGLEEKVDSVHQKIVRFRQTRLAA